MADSSCYRIRATLTALIKAVSPSTGNVKMNKSSPVSTVNDSYARLNSIRRRKSTPRFGWLRATDLNWNECGLGHQICSHIEINGSQKKILSIGIATYIKQQQFDEICIFPIQAISKDNKVLEEKNPVHYFQVSLFVREIFQFFFMCKLDKW